MKYWLNYLTIILGLFPLQNLALAETNTLEKKHKNSADVGWVESRNPTDINYYDLDPHLATDSTIAILEK